MKNDHFDSGLQEFENYLREFRLRRPRALAIVPVDNAQAVYARRLTAVAAILLACMASAWFARHGGGKSKVARIPIVGEAAAEHRAPEQLSSIQLTRLAVSDTKKVEDILAQSPRAKLPRFDKGGGALSVLGKE